MYPPGCAAHGNSALVLSSAVPASPPTNVCYGARRGQLAGGGNATPMLRSGGSAASDFSDD
jgi:hypothetical protein